jgi:hypothetical protein
MAKFIRYALATACFAASVACLALWWRSMEYRDMLIGPSFVAPTRALYFESFDGVLSTTLLTEAKTAIGFNSQWSRWYPSDTQWRRDQIRDRAATSGRFGIEADEPSAYLPIWFLSLVFALAGVGVLRFRRQFSIRSTLVTVTVVAALLGMAVAL